MADGAAENYFPFRIKETETIVVSISMSSNCNMEPDEQLTGADGADHMAELILKHLRQETTEAEQQILKKWIEEHPANKQVFDRITSEEQLMNDLQQLQQVNLDVWWQKISRHTTAPTARPWRRYLKIALIILLLLIAITLLIGFISM
jgi:ferric-dicitrate binding protein FerR (iron transport regulator)